MPDIYYPACPVCKSTKLEKVFTAKDYTVSGREFDIIHCHACTLRFTQNVPNQDAIGDYYKSENYISHSNTSTGFINKLYQKVRNRTMKQKAQIIKKHTGLQTGNLLDVGCGTGTFLHTMQQKGWKITGLEPDSDARKLSQEMYGIVTQPSHELFSLPDNNYDAITMWHVLEHVHPLHEYVAQLKNLLTEKGKLFVAVPNYTSKDASHYQKYWAGYDVPRHLYHFSPNAMEVLMRQHGLKVANRLPMWFDSFYVDMLSCKYQNGKTNYIAAGLHGLASNIHAVGNVQQCCSIIYIIEK